MTSLVGPTGTNGELMGPSRSSSASATSVPASMSFTCSVFSISSLLKGIAETWAHDKDGSLTMALLRAFFRFKFAMARLLLSMDAKAYKFFCHATSSRLCGVGGSRLSKSRANKRAIVLSLQQSRLDSMASPEALRVSCMSPPPTGRGLRRKCARLSQRGPPSIASSTRPPTNEV